MSYPTGPGFLRQVAEIKEKEKQRGKATTVSTTMTDNVITPAELRKKLKLAEDGILEARHEIHDGGSSFHILHILNETLRKAFDYTPSMGVPDNSPKRRAQ